ncbi:MAG: site-specific integrase [Pyrinomonadaceae bacterium]
MAIKKKGTNDWGITTKKNKSTGKDEFYARIVRTDGSGTAKQFTRKAVSKAEARRLRDEMVKIYDGQGEQAIEGSKLIFRELCDIYENKRLQKAEYVGDGRNRRKVRGKRSLLPSLNYVAVLKLHFGAKLVKNITHEDVEDFKQVRLQTPTNRGQRSIVDVNRTLEHLRAILRFATRQGWLSKTPFEMGNPLISKAEENRRERTLTRLEETKLLEACVKRRSHLRPIIITAIDTAMRRGELFKLRWSDVDFESKTINILATNSKVERERIVGITKRVESELRRLWASSAKDNNALVFGIKDTIKTSFRSACKDAGIEDFRFHDFRHTAITRMIEANISPVIVQKVSGHSQFATFQGYVNPDKTGVVSVAEELSKYNEKQLAIEADKDITPIPPVVPEVINLEGSAVM